MAKGFYSWTDDPIVYTYRARDKRPETSKLDDKMRNERLLKEYFSAGGRIKRYSSAGNFIDTVIPSGKLFPKRKELR